MRRLVALPSRLAVALVWLYRSTLGILFPATCKYHPSCSQYAIDALRRYGLLRGSVLAGWRLLRCHPWAAGGVDRVEDQRLFRRGRAKGEPLETPLAMSTSGRAGPPGRSSERPTLSVSAKDGGS